MSLPKRSCLPSLATFAVMLVAAMVHRDAAADERPNVLLILVDDLKPALGCYGDPVAKSPNIDALAARSMRFDLAYCNQAVCAPSRFTLMLGSHSTSTGLYGLGSELRQTLPNAVTLPQYFAKHGYRTESLGKVFHIGHGNQGDPESFSVPHYHDKVIEYLDPNSTDGGKLTREEAYFTNQRLGEIKSLPRGAAFESPDVADADYADGRVALETIQRLRAAKKRRATEGTPFFIAAGFARPHLPFSAPKKYWDLYDAAELPLPEFEDLPANAPSAAGKRGGEITNYKPVPTLPQAKFTQQLKRQLIHGYYASTSFVDAQIGKVLDELNQLGLDENTIVVLWGDHGFHLGDLGIWTKHTNYEQANRIPIVISAPSVVQPGSSTQQPAESVDIFPTLAELAGLPAPSGPQPIDGISLVPVLKDPSTRVRDHAYHAYPKRKLGRAIRTERYRLVQWREFGQSVSEAEYELYDYETDPLERENLAAGNPDVVARLKRTLAKYPEPLPRVQKNAVGKAAVSQATESPKIANRPLTIAGHVASDDENGVIVAQGGREHGYAVHLMKGRLAFDVRVDGEVARIQAKAGAPKEFDLTATLTTKTMSLTIDRQSVARGDSPGLIPVEPKDGMNIGRDERSAAGNYTAPNPLDGRVSKLRVTPGKKTRRTDKPTTKPGQQRFGSITKPLFADPNYNGSCDPEVVWNEHAQEWFIYYTARRATRESATYVGTPLGVISSPDLAHWRFRGYCSFDGRQGQPDNGDTHWAPGILVAAGQLHMFATYKASAEPPWGGDGVIRHYVAPLDDPIDGWKLADTPALAQPDPIDVSLLKVGDKYRAYYRVGKGGGIHWATSADLSTWEKQGVCLGDVNAKDRGFGYQEAPYVFQWQGRFWMLTDPHEGLAVFQSTDGITWKQQPRILQKNGAGTADATLARHPSVAVINDRAFIFYHTEPNRPYPTPPAEQRTPHQKISFLQMAELSVEDGRLQCDRDADIRLKIPNRPNFVFILTDDQGWTGLSVPMDKTRAEWRSDFYRTPNLARLAATGMRFSRGYSPAPNCSPSRYANLTGKTCARLSFTDITGRGHVTDLKGKQKLRPGGKGTRAIRAKDVTTAELLKTLPGGYRTAHFGKWHLAGGGPEKHGFDISDGATSNREGSQGTTVNDDPKRAFSITSRAVAFIEEAVAADRPFYCQVSHYAVHQAIQHRADTLQKTEGWKPGSVHSDPAYAAMVSDLDAAVGVLLDQIERLGIADNTYIIYQADNGSPKHLSESPPLRRYKPEIWDGGVRVPTFLAGPGIAADSQCDVPVMGIDLLPTIWELAGGDTAALPENIDGGSIVPIATAIGTGAAPAGQVSRQGELVVHSPHYVLTGDLSKNQRPSSAIYDSKWKLVAWYETGDIHLFDLDAEVSELTDVGGQYPDAKYDLWLRLRNYLSRVEARMPTLDPLHASHTSSKAGDADADGLPDTWEFRRLLTHALGPADDPDQDGKSNLVEFKANSDPLVPDQATSP